MSITKVFSFHPHHHSVLSLDPFHRRGGSPIQKGHRITRRLHILQSAVSFSGLDTIKLRAQNDSGGGGGSSQRSDGFRRLFSRVDKTLVPLPKRHPSIPDNLNVVVRFLNLQQLRIETTPLHPAKYLLEDLHVLLRGWNISANPLQFVAVTVNCKKLIPMVEDSEFLTVLEDLVGKDVKVEYSKTRLESYQDNGRRRTETPLVLNSVNSSSSVQLTINTSHFSHTVCSRQPARVLFDFNYIIVRSAC